MNPRVRRLRLGTWYAVGLLLVEAAVACGSDDKTPPAKAASGGTSGAGKGGSAGKGGTAGKAGARGGTGGKGGSGNSAGTAGGGTTGVGGSVTVGGTGGVSGSGMMTNPRCTVRYDYAINASDVSVPYSEPSKLREDVDFGQTSTEGAGTPGAVEVTIPFSAEDQLVRVTLTPYEYNLTGLSLSARVMLGKGLTSDKSHPGKARLALKAGLDLVYATGPEEELVEGEWLTLRLDPWNPDSVDANGDPYDATSVYEIDVEIMTGENAGTKYSKATVYIDDFSTCPSTASMGDAGGGGGKGGSGGIGGSSNPGGEGGLPGDAGTGTGAGSGGEGG